MVKKISIIIFVTFILVTGYMSLKKLNYWERTVLIFKLNSPEQSFEGRRGRGLGDMRLRFEGRGQRVDRSLRNRPDSLSSGRLERETVNPARGTFDGRMRDSDGRGGRDLRGRNSINLNNVVSFLAAFAFFTLVTIYLEKVFCLITRKFRN